MKGISLSESLALFGSLQGFFLAAVLWTHRSGNRPGNRILAGLVFLYSLQLLHIVSYWTRWLELFPHFWGATALFPYLYGPLLWTHIRLSLAGPANPPRMKLLHFVPFLLGILLFSGFYLSSAHTKLQYLVASYPDSPRTASPNPLMVVLWGLQFVHFLSYWSGTLRTLNRAPGDAPRKAWLRFLLGAFAATFAIWFSYGMAVSFGLRYARWIDYSATLAMTVTIYSIGYAGLRRPDFFLDWKAAGRTPKYRGSTLDEASAARYQRRLLEVMEKHRPFKDADLRLDDLADLLGLSPHHLSQLINQQFNRNFNEFINGYRVEEAKKLLSDPRWADQSLLTLAFEAGFNNKTSFNQAFKKRVEMTPSRYRAEVLARENG